MKQTPDIEWLQRKWGLPAHAVKPVQDLLREESSGSTACVIAETIADWGAAAGGVESSTPLVIIENGGKQYLQSRRLCAAEHDVATRILGMAGKEIPLPGAIGQLPALFPDAAKSDLQAAAARVAMSRQLTMITGGPGTGKTYTLARILALLVASGIPANSIQLAAPTGKASDRMKRAVSDSLAGLLEDFQKHGESLARVADASSTLHKLLRYNSRTGRTSFNARQPLPCGVLIVDECSMVDVLLWRVVLQALPGNCRLILLGDPNQLESVGQGNVFTELARAAGEAGSPLGLAHVHLMEARRFKDRPDILAFARALEESDADAAAKLLDDSRGSNATRGLAWLENPSASFPCVSFPKPVLDALETVALAESPEGAIAALGKICILTAQREFFVGAKAVSAGIDQHFLSRKGVRNQPVIINQNDPETGLRNGTVGVIHTAPDGKRKAWFQAGDGKLKDVAVAKLPDFSPAWAITIHRSQGSEYDDVLVILPRMESPMATRELLYTAITRARKNVYIAGDMETVKKAVVTSSARCTMLASFLHPNTQVSG